MKNVTATVWLFLALTGTALAQSEGKQAFACAEQASTGFSMKNGVYGKGSFPTTNFTMVLTGRNLTVKYGDDEERYSCSPSYANILQCVQDAFFMVINLENLRFNRGELYGPIRGLDKADSLSVAYGSCQRF